MGLEGKHILTVNAGSSSLKLDVFATGEPPERLASHVRENINPEDAAKILTEWLESSPFRDKISAVGHRIVHGGPDYYESCLLTAEVIEGLRRLDAFDLEHMPNELRLIEGLKEALSVPQFACFDTGFHHDLPPEAQLLAIPRKYSRQGIRRYGFHGLSYRFLLSELERVGANTDDRLILAHLGNGVSLAGVRGGRSQDTTMGLTPAGGVPMSSRSGDLDPGLLAYLMRDRGFDGAKINKMVNFESGLLGISEISADMKTLLDREADDERARDAIKLFVYQIKKAIGGLAAGLGGLDQLVFTGGMGENAPRIRARICEDLEFLGIKLDAGRNDSNSQLISDDNSRVSVRVIHTDEASIIAGDTLNVMNNQ